MSPTLLIPSQGTQAGGPQPLSECSRAPPRCHRLGPRLRAQLGAGLPPSARTPCSASAGKTEAQTELPATFGISGSSPFVSRTRSGRSGLRGGRAPGSAAPGLEPKAPPAAPPRPLPSFPAVWLVCLSYFSFLRGQPEQVCWQRCTSSNHATSQSPAGALGGARGGGERPNRAGATLRPRSPASSGRGSRRRDQWISSSV